MNTKAKGSERRALKVLRASGYTCVRAAASAFVAINAEGLMQCKSNRSQRAAIRALKVPATKEVWIFRDRQSSPLVIAIPNELRRAVLRDISEQNAQLARELVAETKNRVSGTKRGNCETSETCETNENEEP